MTRTLTLKRETLAELNDTELTGVVGGQYSGTGRRTCLDDCFYTILNGCIAETTRQVC